MGGPPLCVRSFAKRFSSYAWGRGYPWPRGQVAGAPAGLDVVGAGHSEQLGGVCPARYPVLERMALCTTKEQLGFHLLKLTVLSFKVFSKVSQLHRGQDSNFNSKYSLLSFSSSPPPSPPQTLKHQSINHHLLSSLIMFIFNFSSACRRRERGGGVSILNV